MIKKVLLREGLYVLIIRIINNLFLLCKINLRINTPIDKYKNYLAELILSISRKKIMYGIYKDTHFIPSLIYKPYNFASKLIGCYELQIIEKIFNLKKKNKFKNIINLGAGDGYHIISLIKKKYFKQGYAFERNKKIWEQLKKNAELNNIKNKIKIYSEGNSYNVINNISKLEIHKSLFLLDIEGDEYFFFKKKNISYFKKSHFIIELHNRNSKRSANFYNLINKNFIVEVIKNSSRNPFEYKVLDEFSDDEKFLMMSENRPNSMKWLYLRPL